ncbi:MAG: hypothetical protein JW724_03810 [Candidatus Altiarchaeota archaeon]|nr:hypothetical protein [Candidatus Altiarchaeota archaeon]
MTKITEKDINESKRETKKVLKHEDVEEICGTDKCVLMKRKKRRLDEEDK